MHKFMGRLINCLADKIIYLLPSYTLAVSIAIGTISSSFMGVTDRKFYHLVEDALRRLYNYSYLGKHELINLLEKTVKLRLVLREAQGPITTVDRGKALREVLIEAVNLLRPDAEKPKALSKEWHYYIIIHDEYISIEEPTTIKTRRKLNIGEGTFYRRRREAIWALVEVLRETERQVREWK
jgi:hypothetical protein